MKQDQAAERALIGAALLRGEVRDLCAVPAEDFFSPRNGEIWRAMGRLRAQTTAIDPLTIHDELGDRAEACGGFSYISDCLREVPTADNADHYARLVTDAALDRRIREGLASLLASESEGRDLLGEALARLSSIEVLDADSAVPIGTATREAILDLYAGLQRIEAGEPASWGLPTGFPVLDAALGGIQPGVVTILAGRPSMGKSSLARSIADSVAAAGHGVHVFSLEDSRRAYALRVLADHSRVDLHRLRGLDLRQGEMDPITAAGNDLMQRTGWFLDDTSSISSAEVALRVRRHKSVNKTRMVVVDYVQLMRERDARAGDKKTATELALAGLCDLARRENMAVLLLSQLSRECERRDNKRPLLSDLRETGELEQAADAVLFLYRDEVYDPSSRDKGIAECLVAKNKHGKTGILRLHWDGPTASLRPLVERMVA